MTSIFRNLMFTIFAATLIAGCENQASIPPEKSDYVGEWQHPTISLIIRQNGSVEYNRQEGTSSKSFKAQLKAFDGDNFIVGFGPMDTTFVVSKPPHQEGENWVMTVDGVQLIRAKSSQTGSNIPGKAEQISLTKKSMHDFAVSVNNKSMEHFRNSICKLWQNQFSTEKLNETYGAFFNLGVDLTVLDPLEPIFEGDALIDKDGLLIIKGHYPTKPSQVTFEHKYLYENAAWKLAGFSINIAASKTPQTPQTGPNIPGKAEQISLTKKSMHDFAVSVNNKNMEHFRRSISKLWQNQFSTEKLNEAYGALFNVGDLTVLDPLEPIFEGDALIDKDGLLVIKGHYLIKQNKVTFEHKYYYEDAAWKLLGFHINIQ